MPHSYLSLNTGSGHYDDDNEYEDGEDDDDEDDDDDHHDEDVDNHEVSPGEGEEVKA